MRTQFRSSGDRHGAMFYAAELTVGDHTFGRVAISTPAEGGKIDIAWYDVRKYDTASHILAHVKGRQLIEGRAKSSAFASGQLAGVEPEAIQSVIGRGDVLPSTPVVVVDPDATVQP